MYKTVNFNIYKENLDKIIFGGQKVKQTEGRHGRKDEVSEKPIPKPAPDFRNFPLNYKKDR